MRRTKRNLRRITKRGFLAIALIGAFSALMWAETREVLRSSAEVHFKQSSSVLDTAHFDNGRHIRSLVKDLEPEKEALGISKVTVVGGASPEGSIEYNRKLSHNRAESIFEYINSQVALPDSITSFKFLGRDWKGLRKQVVADPNVPARDEVIRLLDEIISNIELNGEEIEGRHNLNRLRKIASGRAYSYMYSRMFPRSPQVGSDCGIRLSGTGTRDPYYYRGGNRHRSLYRTDP